MIEPLREQLVRLLLDGIRYDRLGETGSTGATQFQSDSVIKGVIGSFVSVEEYKKKGNLDVSTPLQTPQEPISKFYFPSVVRGNFREALPEGHR